MDVKKTYEDLMQLSKGERKKAMSGMSLEARDAVRSYRMMVRKESKPDVMDEMSPDVSVAERAYLKNFGTQEERLKYLQEAKPDHIVRMGREGGFGEDPEHIYLQKKGSGKAYPFDLPPKDMFESGQELLNKPGQWAGELIQDVTDVGVDLAQGAAEQGTGLLAGAATLASTGNPYLAYLARQGAMGATAGASEMGRDLFKSGVNQLTDVPLGSDGVDLGKAGTSALISTLIPGFAKQSGKAVEGVAKKRAANFAAKEAKILDPKTTKKQAKKLFKSMEKDRYNPYLNNPAEIRDKIAKNLTPEVAGLSKLGRGATSLVSGVPTQSLMRLNMFRDDIVKMLPHMKQKEMMSQIHKTQDIGDALYDITRRSDVDHMLADTSSTAPVDLSPVAQVYDDAAKQVEEGLSGVGVEEQNLIDSINKRKYDLITSKAEKSYTPQYDYTVEVPGDYKGLRKDIEKTGVDTGDIFKPDSSDVLKKKENIYEGMSEGEIDQVEDQVKDTIRSRIASEPLEAGNIKGVEKAIPEDVDELVDDEFTRYLRRIKNERSAGVGRVKDAGDAAKDILDQIGVDDLGGLTFGDANITKELSNVIEQKNLVPPYLQNVRDAVSIRRFTNPDIKVTDPVDATQSVVKGLDKKAYGVTGSILDEMFPHLKANKQHYRDTLAAGKEAQEQGLMTRANSRIGSGETSVWDLPESNDMFRNDFLSGEKGMGFTVEATDDMDKRMLSKIKGSEEDFRATRKAARGVDARYRKQGTFRNDKDYAPSLDEETNKARAMHEWVKDETGGYGGERQSNSLMRGIKGSLLPGAAYAMYNIDAVRENPSLALLPTVLAGSIAAPLSSKAGIKRSFATKKLLGDMMFNPYTQIMRSGPVESSLVEYLNQAGE